MGAGVGSDVSCQNRVAVSLVSEAGMRRNSPAIGKCDERPETPRTRAEEVFLIPCRRVEIEPSGNADLFPFQYFVFTPKNHVADAGGGSLIKEDRMVRCDETLPGRDIRVRGIELVHTARRN